MTRTTPTFTRLRTRACVAGVLLGAGLAGVVAAPAGADLIGGAGAAAARASVRAATPTPPLLGSPLLWATVDVCGPPDQTASFGIRGSMPGDGASSENMYMRFRVQYRDPTSGQWTFLTTNGDSGYVAAGSSRYRYRQSGWIFQFVAPAAVAQSAYRLRGVVDFQWRKGNTVVLASTLYTTAGHNSGASADPPGYTSATCTIA